MQLVYTTGWTRKNLSGENGYLEWLRSLKNGDHVLIQNFHPASNGALDLPFERWEFVRARIYDNRLYTQGGTNPFDRDTGKLKYWNSDDDWGDVFPARIIPTHSDLPTKELGDRIWGHLPVYEPLFLNVRRVVLLSEYGADIDRSRNRIKKAFPYSYSLEIGEGELHHCFTQDEHEESDRKTKVLTDAGIKFLYSQYCKP